MKLVKFGHLIILTFSQLARSKPGVVTHLEHVIVTGGGLGDTIHDNIEVLNWVEEEGIFCQCMALLPL